MWLWGHGSAHDTVCVPFNFLKRSDPALLRTLLFWWENMSLSGRDTSAVSGPGAIARTDTDYAAVAPPWEAPSSLSRGVASVWR